MPSSEKSLQENTGNYDRPSEMSSTPPHPTPQSYKFPNVASFHVEFQREIPELLQGRVNFQVHAPLFFSKIVI
jgi:hypothetical protein